jgi:Tfp pilus assembly protein PilF
MTVHMLALSLRDNPGIPLGVSIAAAIISAFSAWTSTRQLHRTQRTRLGELVDEIGRADAEFDRNLTKSNFKIDELVVSYHNLRQEVLARQALELVRTARPRPSSREIVILANTFWKMDDHKTTEMLFKRALHKAGREGPSYMSTVHEEYGVYLFDIGEFEEASAQLVRAAAAISLQGGDRSLQRNFRCLGMRAVQYARHDYQLDEAGRILQDAEKVLDKIQGADFREEMQGDLRDYKSQVREARHRMRKQHGEQ